MIGRLVARQLQKHPNVKGFLAQKNTNVTIIIPIIQIRKHLQIFITDIPYFHLQKFNTTRQINGQADEPIHIK